MRKSDKRLEPWATWDNVQQLENHPHPCFACGKELHCERVKHFGSDLNGVGYSDIIHYVEGGEILRFPCGHCPDSKHVGCKINKNNPLFLKYRIGSKREYDCHDRIFCEAHIPKDAKWERTSIIGFGGK